MNFHFIGWNNEAGHDKIWMSFQDLAGNEYTAWGRRGSKFQVKRTVTRQRTTESKKRNSGYKEVDEFLLFTLFPSFKEDIEELLFVRTLDGSVR